VVRLQYPHQVASYWAMYHVARHYDKLTTYRPWHWYLERAAKTALRFSCGTGVMDGTVFREVLDALKAEGTANATIAGWAAELDTHMRGRQVHWARQRFPYGSEFAFDTTGQEEVVVWNMYYGDELAAKATVDHILSYMRSIPSWAYNGGARAADSGNNGKWMPSMGTGKPDRGQMHYRSGLNMIPLLEWYRSHPDDFFLLEVSMGAIGGQMTNIDEHGATSMFFHGEPAKVEFQPESCLPLVLRASENKRCRCELHATAYPWVMDFDPHSGDYGLGFFGNALESGSYYVEHPRLGPLCFLCSASTTTGTAENTSSSTSTSQFSAGTAAAAATTIIKPADAYHKRVFIEPLSVYLVAVAGTIAQLDFSKLQAREVSLTFNATEWGRTPWSQLRLRVHQTSAARGGSDGGACQVTHAGARVVPTAIDNTSYVFPHTDGAETEVVIKC
jgi:hypothetical protein